MLEAILSGSLLGLSAGFSPGPLLVLVISITLRHSMAEGLKASLAPLITDLPIVILALWLMSLLRGSGIWLGVISLAGALFVIYLGVGTLQIKGIEEPQKDDKPHSIRKAALVNFLSPHPYLFWFTVGAPQVVKLSAIDWSHGGGFIFCFYLCLVGSKMLTTLLFDKARAFLAGKPYLYAMRILGSLLIVFGLIMIKEALELLDLIAA